MKKKTFGIVTAALIAAVYAVLTYLTAIFGIAYGPIQFRISEAMFILVAFTPYAVPGLTIGCVLANLTSPYGIIDIVVGTFATLIGALTSYIIYKKMGEKSLWVLPLIPALSNGLLVGAEIAFMTTTGAAFLTAFSISAAEVALGELAVCYALGIPLYYILKKTGLKKHL